MAIGPQVLGEALPREVDHGVGSIEDRLASTGSCGRASPLRAGGREMRREIEDVAHRRGAKRIDRLRVVADDRDAVPSGFIASRIDACSRLVS